MTNTNEAKVREQFEAYANEHYLLCERSKSRNEHQQDEYIDCDMQVSWEAWQASRAAVVVELPDPNEVHDSGDYCAEAIDAIEAQGLKVKP